MKVQDLNNTLKDDEVKALFVELFTDKLEQCVLNCAGNLIAEITDKFTKKIDDINVSVLSLHAEIQRKDAIISDFQIEKSTAEN